MTPAPPMAFPDHLPPLPRDRSPGIGCIGAGFIMADCHLPAYRAAGFNVVAIAARRREAVADVAARYGIATVHDSAERLLDDPAVAVVDIAVPPDVQPALIRAAAARPHVRGILAQKPLAGSHAEAAEAVRACAATGTALVVNQNMRHDHAVATCRRLLERGDLGAPVLATIEMRAIPHWMPWQERQGWMTLRIMSIHHLDCLRGWFGDPRTIFTAVRSDPRTAARFAHVDGICTSVLQYDSGLVCTSLEDVWAGPAREGAEGDAFVRFRVEGTRGTALGTIGWPRWPDHAPSTLDWTTTAGGWHRPRWPEAWFPDAFVGPMAELLRDLEGTAPATCTGADNLMTMALVDAAYRSAREGRAVDPREIVGEDDARGHSRPAATRRKAMRLGLINSAFAQAGKGTRFGLEQTKRLGFDSVDLLADPLVMSAEERRLIPAVCRELDLPIVSLCCVSLGLIDWNPPIRDCHLARTKAHVDLCAEYGCTNLLLVLGEYVWQKECVPPQEQWDLAVDACRRLGAYAADRGVRIAIELEPFHMSLVNSIDSMLRLLDEVGLPDTVRANCDISHLHIVRTPPAEIARLAGRIEHVHLSDCDGTRHGDLPPGRGVTPIADYLAAIRDTGYDGTVSVELEFAPDPAGIVDWVAEAHDATAKIMADLGCRR